MISNKLNNTKYIMSASRENGKTKSDGNFDHSVSTDTTQAQDFALLGTHDKLKSDQSVRSRYGLDDDIDTKGSNRKQGNSSNWFSEKTWRILLVLAIITIIALVIVVVYTSVSATPSNDSPHHKSK